MNKDSEKCFKNTGRALDVGLNVGTTFASRIPKAASLSLPEMTNFPQTGKELYLGSFFIYFISQMATPTLKLHPSAPLEKDDFQQRLERN